MRLRRLSLHGFKSFADRTELTFHDGITAIVGPNGCGKSNISDAIRWVLGEQRASAIRGSRMDEAIFQGTAERRAVNRAEVALAFSNDGGRFALPHDEVELQRTVFREGGSEYALNRASCRLKDVLDLLRDTGLGANAYAVIEQRMVDGILSDRADERRGLFEEAAGIGRYKDRRRAAQRRLEAAETDLARLRDVIGEVESKVRSLARQRGRAQRFTTMRARRLSLEIALSAMELEEAGIALEEISGRLAALVRDEPGARAELSAAETQLERQRVDAADAARERNALAASVEETSRRIAERERELAVADERRVHAERRIQQIATEREEIRTRRTALETERSDLDAERVEEERRVEALGQKVTEAQRRQQALRADLGEARRGAEQARAREADLSRRIGQAEADAAAADARAAEAESRIGRLGTEREGLETELAVLNQQRDLFAERTGAIESSSAALEEERRAAAVRLESLRSAEDEARTALAHAEDEASALAGRLSALEALDREYHGFAPAVAAALAARGRLDGFLGPLAELLELPPGRGAAVEATLNSLLQALVVEDAAAVERVRQWLETEHPDEGSVALLPRPALAEVESLLRSVQFAGRPPGEPALLGRRERVEALRSEAAAAARERDARAAARAGCAEQVAAAGTALREAESAAQSAELELRRAESDEAGRTGQRARLEQAIAELARQSTDATAAAEQARDAAIAAREERARLEAERTAHRTEGEEAARTLSEREDAWEAMREQEAELRVEHARAEGTLATIVRRIAAAADGLERAAHRLEALDREEAEHRSALVQIEELRSGAGAVLQESFEQRDALAVDLRTHDERVAAVAEAAATLEVRVRTLRRSAEERGEERHRLELHRAEHEGTARRVRERLEAEWGKPFDQLVREAEAVDGEPEGLRAELSGLAADLERLGPVNMLAVEEHDEERRRLEFLTGQHEDLVRARDDLRTAIREINATAKELFEETFEQVRANFQRTFETLFEGGECNLRLADDEDPLESDIDIAASPRGKRTQRIDLLSGGERALTALALLFAVYLVKPSPFCVLDEVDAPLDEANIGRFVTMIQRFKAETQFIIITHNPRTIEAADWIYGVTMEHPGVSTIVGVQLDDALVAAGGGD